jgi:hypothetical protein
MSVPSSTIPTGRPDTTVSGRAGRRVRKDLDKCEAFISQAAKAGTVIEEADVNAVREARCAFDRRAWTAAIGSAFYAAMARIAKAVQYPGPSIVEDMAHCREMVSYGAQNGKLLAEADVQALSNARTALQNRAWNADTEAAFYAAMSRIAHALSPVVAETAGDEARRGARIAIRIYTRAAMFLTVVVISLSCLLFVVNQISSDIANYVKENDATALTMHNQLIAHEAAIADASNKNDYGALLALQNSQPALQIKEELQKFAMNNRQLYANISRISWITRFAHLGTIRSPYKQPCIKGEKVLSFQSTYRHWADLEYSRDKRLANDFQCNPVITREALEMTLPVLSVPYVANGEPIPPNIGSEVVAQGFQKIAVYQDIRAMALYACDIILSFVGAVTGFLLPVLYAWLGACAAILRQLSADSAASTFHPEHSKVANRAHVTSAVIVGISIGLFTKLLEGGKDISPLALAFVAGYASDKFFYFVDRLVGAIFPPRDDNASTQVTPPPLKAMTPPDTSRAQVSSSSNSTFG